MHLTRLWSIKLTIIFLLIEQVLLYILV